MARNDEEESSSRPGEGGDAAVASRSRRLLHDWRFLAGAGVIAALAVALFWWYSSRWQSTDDAQIDGHIVPVSARISGQVKRVNFEDNQFVKAGTVVVQIDRTDYEVAYKRARADYANALATAEAAKTSVPITVTTTGSSVASARSKVENAQAAVVAAEKELEAAQAVLREAEANNARDQADLKRYEPLIAKGIVSQEFFDQTVAKAKSSAATADAARATLNATRQQVVQAKGAVDQSQAELRAARTAPQQVAVARDRQKSADAAADQARAAMDQARLNLGYTAITAPVDGIVGQKAVEPGQYVQPGQQLLVIVPVNDIWVTANFKETQLKSMRPGQRARIEVDAFGNSYSGYVESIGGASGALFSLFPPENATGNYVKVVQRIPVRIRFDQGQDPGHLLRPGMSVVPMVRVK
jgi:membrane fusion protein (multidrug efflux system)